MTETTRSSVFAFKEETTEGTLETPVAADFVAGRDGFTFQGELETIASDELVDDIGASKSFATKEVPKGSFPKYLRHSGTEGSEPEYGIIIESAMGTKTVNGTEYDTIAGSTAGTSTTRGKCVVDSGEGSNFAKGQALLIKDGTNGYSIRNVRTISTDDLNLNFNLASAPGTGVNLGKAVQYSPISTGHPTYSAYHYGASTSSGYKQAIAGCRTTALNFEFPANGFAEINFDFEGIEYFYNYITIDATNNKINFKDLIVGSELTATLDSGDYKSPIALAAEIASKMTTASAASQADTISCSFSSSTGKFTLSTSGAEFQLLWSTGTNGSGGTDTHAGTILGYSDAADDTGATSYAADNAQSYDAPATPSYDDSDNLVLKNAELLIGDFFETTNRKCVSASCTIGAPKTDVPDFTAENGIDSSIINSREVTFNATLILQQHEVSLFDAFINNSTRSLMFNCGTKSAGDWVAGTCFNLYMANASFTTHTNDDNDGYRVVTLTAIGHVDESQKDVYINFV